MNFLITGGLGQMGQRLVEHLASPENTIRILSLPGEKIPPNMLKKNIEIVLGDITKEESLPAAMFNVDIVFHLAAILLAPGKEEKFEAINSMGTLNMVRVAEQLNINHFIYVSSISVIYPIQNSYSKSKLKGESWVSQSKLKNFTIVRPSLAYQNNGAEEFMQFVAYLKKSPVILLPAGGRALKRPVLIEDLVWALAKLPKNSQVYGKTYYLMGGDSLSLRAMATMLLQHMGKSKRILGIPIWICKLATRFFTIYSKITKRKNPFTNQTLTGLIQDAAPVDGTVLLDLDYCPKPFHEGIHTLVTLKNCLVRKN